MPGNMKQRCCWRIAKLCTEVPSGTLLVHEGKQVKLYSMRCKCLLIAGCPHVALVNDRDEVMDCFPLAAGMAGVDVGHLFVIAVGLRDL